MTLFTLLLVLAWERLFKLGEYWQLDHRLDVVFMRLNRFSLVQTMLLTTLWMGLVWLVLRLLQNILFGFPLLLMWVLICLLCIGAGGIRRHYRAYLKAARQEDAHATDKMAQELALIHGLPLDSGERIRLQSLQNTLLWINFRYYLAPIFWFVVCANYGPVALAGYAMLRGYQAWLARYHTPLQRSQSGIDRILHWLDWIPVRLMGVAYALLGHGERALPAWFASLGDFRSQQYQVLTQLAQYSLAREPHLDSVQTPRAAVSLARKVTLTVIVVVALLTIYGTLI